MNKTVQETPFFLRKLSSLDPHMIYIGPYNRPRRLLKGWHLFLFHPVYIKIALVLNSVQFAIHLIQYWVILSILREKFVSKLGFEPQISSFTHWRSTIQPLETHIIIIIIRVFCPRAGPLLQAQFEVDRKLRN